MRWPETPFVDLLAVQNFERWIKQAAGKAHDVAFDDPTEALYQLDCVVGMAGEMRAVILRHAEAHRERIESEEARREMASAVPGIDPVRC